MHPRDLCHASIMYACMGSDISAQLAMTLGARIELWHTQSLAKNAHFLAKDSRGQKGTCELLGSAWLACVKEDCVSLRFTASVDRTHGLPSSLLSFIAMASICISHATLDQLRGRSVVCKGSSLHACDTMPTDLVGF